jgi:hypothetical protein
MAKKEETVPVQHTPKHLEGDVFDPRHPAASSFAPLQPAAGVVADDADERGQNLRGGPKASDAHKDNLDQTDKLREQYEESLQVAAPTVAAANVEGDKATPASGASKFSK